MSADTETTMDTVEMSENGQSEPSKSEASVISDDYDPSIPTDEKDAADALVPSRMKVAELRSELMDRGLDTKGNKASLVQRLEEAITAGVEGGAEGEPAEEVEDEDTDEENAVEKVNEDDDDLIEIIESLDEEEMETPEDVEAKEANDNEDSDDTISQDQKQPEEEPMEQSTEPQELEEQKTEEEPKADQKPQQQKEEQPASEIKATKKAAVKESMEAPATPPATKVLLMKKPAVTSELEKETIAKKDEESKPAEDAAKPQAATTKQSEKITKEEKKKSDAPPPELDKYWKAVKDKPTDFTGWTYLLQYVEQQDHMPSVRKAFDSFLARYPYCYGYWKKFADLERKKAIDTQKAHEVFDKGLKSIPLSVDLWMQFIQFVGQTESKENVTEKLREVYIKAIAAAGTDFRSDKLWDMYINFEKDRNEWHHVTEIYDKLLTIPTQLYSHHFEKFKEHVNNKDRHPKDILSVDEFIKLRMEVVEVLGVAEPGIDDDDLAPPGDDDAPPGVEVGVPGLSSKRGSSSVQIEAENQAIRKKVIESRTTIYRQTEQEVSKRWAYEEGIRRPYFHAKPLEKSQLKNWREYLDFETANGTHERVLILYERCLVACALYEEFWMKYAKYLEPHSIEGVSSVYRRACNIHLPRKPSIHLRWAAFEETQGNVSAAKDILQKLEENLPDLIMVTLERLSLERRLGNTDEVVNILKNRMEVHNKPQIKFFLGCKLSRYYSKVLNDVTCARKVLYDVLEETKDKAKIYLQLLDLEIQQLPNNEQIILDLLQKGVTASTNIDGKMRFSQRRLTYLMDFGTEVSKLQTAYEEHQELLKAQLELLQTANKKRLAETPALSQPEKKAKKEQPTFKVTATTPTVTPSKPPSLMTPSTPAPTPAAPVYNGAQDYTQSSQQPAGGQNTGSWGNYNQTPPYGTPGPNYGPPPGPGGFNAPPNNNYNQQYQQYQQYQQAWGNYNQGYHQR